MGATRAHQRQRFINRACGVALCPPVAQQLQHAGAHRFIVINHQHAGVEEARLATRIGRPVIRCRRTFPHCMRAKILKPAKKLASFFTTLQKNSHV